MRLIVRLAGVLLAAWWPVEAQQPLSAGEAVAIALRTHPSLLAGAARTEASAGWLNQAGLRPNPRLSIQTENWRPYGTPSFDANVETDTFAYLTQPFETAGKRARRREVAAAAVRRMELERELLFRQIAFRVRHAYWAAAGAARVRTLWDENGQTFQQIVRYHEVRVREGAMAGADLLKVQLEGERLAVAANSAALDAERARIQLFREMGQAEFPAAVFATPLELGGEPAAGAADPVASRSEVKLARLAVEQARANLRLQQANARPDIDAVLGYKRTGGFHTAVGGIQFALPWSNRNQGSIAAASAEIRASEADLAAAEALVKAEATAARKEVDLRRAQLTGLLKRSLERAVESSRIAQAAYREGGAELLRLLDAERVRIELEVLYYRTLSEYRQSVAALEAAMGVAP